MSLAKLFSGCWRTPTPAQSGRTSSGHGESQHRGEATHCAVQLGCTETSTLKAGPRIPSSNTGVPSEPPSPRHELFQTTTVTDVSLDAGGSWSASSKQDLPASPPPTEEARHAASDPLPRPSMDRETSSSKRLEQDRRVSFAKSPSVAVVPSSSSPSTSAVAYVSPCSPLRPRAPPRRAPSATSILAPPVPGTVIARATASMELPRSSRTRSGSGSGTAVPARLGRLGSRAGSPAQQTGTISPRLSAIYSQGVSWVEAECGGGGGHGVSDFAPTPCYFHGLSPRHSRLFDAVPRVSGSGSVCGSEAGGGEPASGRNSHGPTPRGGTPLRERLVLGTSGLEHMSRLLRLATQGRPLAETMAEHRAAAAARRVSIGGTGTGAQCFVRPAVPQGQFSCRISGSRQPSGRPDLAPGDDVRGSAGVAEAEAVLHNARPTK